MRREHCNVRLWPWSPQPIQQLLVRTCGRSSRPHTGSVSDTVSGNACGTWYCRSGRTGTAARVWATPHAEIEETANGGAPAVFQCRTARFVVFYIVLHCFEEGKDHYGPKNRLVCRFLNSCTGRVQVQPEHFGKRPLRNMRCAVPVPRIHPTSDSGVTL